MFWLASKAAKFVMIKLQGAKLPTNDKKDLLLILDEAPSRNTYSKKKFAKKFVKRIVKKYVKNKSKNTSKNTPKNASKHSSKNS